MPLITVNQGGSDIAAGTYPVVLTKLDGPKTIVPKSGPNAGEPVDIFAWTFVVAANSGPASGEEIEATTSTASGPRSKMYSWLTALLGGQPPAVGRSFEASDLVGKSAIAQISRSESGWPRIDSLMAFPSAPQPVAVAPVGTTSHPTQPSGLPF